MGIAVWQLTLGLGVVYYLVLEHWYPAEVMMSLKGDEELYQSQRGVLTAAQFEVRGRDSPLLRPARVFLIE